MASSSETGPQPLNGEQVNYAIELIEQQHKLRQTPLGVVWPFLNYTCCCLMKKRQKRFDLALKRSLRRRLALHNSKTDQLLEEDPFLMLGYGMNSYFDVMKQLMGLFAVITLFLAPVMWYLSRFDALAEYPGYGTNQFSLGNIGGA